VQTGRGTPVLVTELQTCLAVSTEAEKQSLAIFFIFGPICVLQGGKYSARSEVSFPPFKTQIRPKTTKIESGGLF